VRYSFTNVSATAKHFDRLPLLSECPDPLDADLDGQLDRELVNHDG